MLQLKWFWLGSKILLQWFWFIYLHTFLFGSW
jgi:hypothetical protein